MTQYNTLNVKLSNSQLNKSKSGMKNDTEVTLKLSSNCVGDSINENNSAHQLLLTNTQVSGLRKDFENDSSANINFSKAQLHKIGNLGGFCSSLLGPFLKSGLHLIGNLLKPLSKSVLIPLALTVPASATDAASHKKMFGSVMTTLTNFNEQMNDIRKIVKSLEESGLLINNVTEIIHNKTKEQKGLFLGMLLGTLRASLLGNMLAGKELMRAGEGTIRAGQIF